MKTNRKLKMKQTIEYLNEGQWKAILKVAEEERTDMAVQTKVWSNGDANRTFEATKMLKEQKYEDGTNKILVFSKVKK